MEVLLDSCRRRDVKSLLLLYLFLLKTGANCPKPEGLENIVLTNEALLLNSFTEGSDVTVECAKGYVRESGSGRISCNDGHWSEPDLICKKKDCGLPKAQPHMSFNPSDGTLFGAMIKVICDKGYQISGSSYKQCFAAGWSGKSKCENITCEIPGEVTHGKNSWESQNYPKYGEIIHYVCNDGYTLTGKDSIMCSEDGEYDSQPPECKEDVVIRVTTEDTITTSVVTPTPTTPTQEASTTTESSATETADKTIITSAVPPLATVSPPAQGGRDTLTAVHKPTTTSVTSATHSSFQELDKYEWADNNNTGYTNVTISVICVVLVVCIVAFFIYKLGLRKKGSYDTREDLKPELLQFQNV